MPCSQSLVLVIPGHSTPPQRRRQMLGGGDTRRAHPKSLSGGAAFSSAPAVDILRSGAVSRTAPGPPPMLGCRERRRLSFSRSSCTWSSSTSSSAAPSASESSSTERPSLSFCCSPAIRSLARANLLMPSSLWSIEYIMRASFRQCCACIYLAWLIHASAARTLQKADFLLQLPQAMDPPPCLEAQQPAMRSLRRASPTGPIRCASMRRMPRLTESVVAGPPLSRKCSRPSARQRRAPYGALHRVLYE